jgi:hypothetical protein
VPHRIVTTVEYAADTGWADRTEMIPGPATPLSRLAGRSLRATRDADVAVLDGSGGLRGDLAVAMMLRWCRPRLRIVIVDATWKSGAKATWSARFLRRLALRAFDCHRISYGVLSRQECATVPATWGVDAERVFFIPWYVRLPAAERALTPNSGEVFCGGDSLRDFPTVLEAARGASFSLHIASRRLAPETAPQLTNVTIESLSHKQFVNSFRRAAAVVVPLEKRSDRSAGQQTYLRAMALGVPVVVTDAIGVRDYIDDGRTGWITPCGDSNALRARLEWVLDPANVCEVEAVASAGRAAAANFDPRHTVHTLLKWIDGLL